MDESKIEWTTHTHNFWTGCTKVSPACDHCYAETIALRYDRAKFGKGEARWRPSELTANKPYKWNEAAKKSGERPRVFTLSMGDFFDTEVPTEWRTQAWNMIEQTPRLDWLILTKRINLVHKMLPDDFARAKWRHVWIGTTVEDQNYADTRIPQLQKIPAAVRFLSVEPLLGPITFKSLKGIHWVIVGGESGHGNRPMKKEWVESIQKQCAAAGVAFFFKQWGGRTPKQHGRELNGKTYNEFPESPAQIADEKRKIAQKKRAKKARKKVSRVTLSNSAMSKLEKLAEEKGVDSREYLEELINKA